VEAFEINCGNCDGINAVRVAVEIALVTMSSTIATGKNEKGPPAITTVLDTIQYSTLDEIAWALHGPAVIRRTPGTAINRGIVVLVVECGGLVDVCDGPGEDADACDFGIVCNAHAANVIFHCPNLASTTCPVVVIGKFWCRELFVVIVVMRTVSPLPNRKKSYTQAQCGTNTNNEDCTYKVISEVLALIVQPVVHEGSNNTGTSDAHIPQSSDVHHMLWIFFVDQMPLPGKQRVVNAKLFNDGLREWMCRRIVFIVSGMDGRRRTFYTLAEFLAGEMFDTVRYTSRDVTIGISCGKRTAESLKGSKYTVLTSIALCEGYRRGFFWYAHYPEVFELPYALDDLHIEPTGDL
jgi:hypothetical protein